MNEITLAEIFGVLPENLICYQNADGTFFADSRAEPKLSDTVLCRFDDDFSIKAFSDVAPPVSPLRLVARNGVRTEMPVISHSFEIVGVVTHIVSKCGGVR